MKSISYYDNYENFCHGFLVELLEYSDEDLVESKRESGTGRNDILIKNVLARDIAVILEIQSAGKDERCKVKR